MCGARHDVTAASRGTARRRHEFDHLCPSHPRRSRVLVPPALLCQPDYVFDTAASRTSVQCVFATARDPYSHAALAAVDARPDLFDDRRGSFRGVSFDPDDESEKRAANAYPGYRHFWDFDAKVGRVYEALPSEPARTSPRPHPTPVGRARSDSVRARGRALCPRPRGSGSRPRPAQGEESGFVNEVGGRTVCRHNQHSKRRKDHKITDNAVMQATRGKSSRRVVPEIREAHEFRITRMERYLVACYAAEDEAHFRPHRDTTTKGTAHRRFAASINLDDDFDGGERRFPEFEPRTYKAPVGAAVIFSCSLLHTVSTVTRGRRYAFLPFPDDEEAARIREASNAFLDDGIGPCRAGGRGSE